MNWINLKKHKAGSSSEPEVWINIDDISQLEPFRDNGCIVVFRNGRKDYFYCTPSQILETIKGLLEYDQPPE